MLKLTMNRYKQTKYAIFSNLIIEDENGNVVGELKTVENPVISHIRGADGAIPAGGYDITMRVSPKFSAKFNGHALPWIHNNIPYEEGGVPKDRYVLMHHGNTEKDSLACILVVSSTNDVDRGFESVKAMNKLLALFDQYNADGSYLVVNNNF